MGIFQIISPDSPDGTPWEHTFSHCFFVQQLQVSLWSKADLQHKEPAAQPQRKGTNRFLFRPCDGNEVGGGGGGGGQGRPASRGPRGQILKAALIWKWNHSVLKRWWKGSREKLRRSRTLRPVCSRAATSAAFLASSGRLRKNKKRETLHSDSSSEGLGVFF